MGERALSGAAAGLSLAGLGVSTYLTIAHYDTAKVLACPENGLVNCTKVTTSSYSSQLGVPLAVIGIVYFAVMVALQSPVVWRSTSPTMATGRLVWAAGGAVTALWLIYVELFRVDAICLYCTAVHAIAIVVFGLTVVGVALGDRVDAEIPGGH